jgi:RNA polymerase sigma factor (sigma-70 family)
MAGLTDDDVRRRLDAVWRIEAGTITGALARLLRDVGLAEEMAQDALVSALEHWPRDGLPTNPGAWLMATAKNKALDRLRQIKLHDGKHQELGADADARGDHVVPDFVDALDAARADEIGDDLLRLIFTACHPVCPHEQRAALTLKLLGGLSTAEIARAYMLPEATVAQRIVRAKRTLAAAKVPFEVPRADALAERLASVLEVIYLIFNEGYSATAGSEWMRQPLCDEALRLARRLQGLFAGRAGEREVHGLAALLEIQASRLASRVNAQGEPILLLDQDRRLWDRLTVGRGLQALARAAALPGAPGPYELQAAIAACHARAARAADTDWRRIVALYDQLLGVLPSPVVRLNRAVALGMAEGAAAALPEVQALTAEPALQRYHLLHAVRGDLLAKLGRGSEAREAFDKAAQLTGNARERALMLPRPPATLA